MVLCFRVVVSFAFLRVFVVCCCVLVVVVFHFCVLLCCVCCLTVVSFAFVFFVSFRDVFVFIFCDD